MQEEAAKDLLGIPREISDADVSSATLVTWNSMTDRFRVFPYRIDGVVMTKEILTFDFVDAPLRGPATVPPSGGLISEPCN